MTTEVSDQTKQNSETYRGMKAAVYIRNSTPGSRRRLKRQREMIRRYAASRGIAILEGCVYQDDASGKRGRRQAGREKLMAVVKGGKAPFRRILVYDKTRWTRNPDELGADERTLKRHGVRLVSLADETDGHVPA